MYEKQTKNKTQTNKQYKRILEQQVRLSEGSAVCLSCYLSLKLTIRNSPQNLSFWMEFL